MMVASIFVKSPTVITSKLPTKSWHQAIGDATIAAA
jgi:hypothetical protein